MSDYSFIPTRINDLITEGHPICYGVLKPGQFQPSGVPLVRIVDIPGNVVATDGLFRITSRLDVEFARSRLRGGELLLSIQGTVGRVALAPSSLANANISRTIARLDIDDRFCTQYIRHYLLSEHGQKLLDDAVIGTTRDSLNLGALRLLFIPLPRLEVQGRIARILTTVDSLIEQTEALIVKYKSIKQGMMHDLFTRGVDQSGRLRSSYEDAPELYKESELGWIPKEWDCTRCQELCEPITKGTTPPAPSMDDHYGRNTVPFLRILNLSFDGSLQFEKDPLFISEQIHRGILRRSRLFPNDVLTNLVGPPLGKVSIVPDDYPEWNLNQAIAIFRLRREITPQYLSCYLQTDEVKRWFLRRSKRTSGQVNLTLEMCQELPVPVPQLVEEREAMQHRLESVFADIAAESHHLRKLVTIKSGLMQDLLTGKVRVNVDQTEEVTANV